MATVIFCKRLTEVRRVRNRTVLSPKGSWRLETGEDAPETASRNMKYKPASTKERSSEKKLRRDPRR